ncbi:MAG: thiamine pyrophosphate-dependent enzyme [Bacteroidota bacterium]
METLTAQVQSSYLAEHPVFPFCKGCGHTVVLRKLNEALVSLQLAPEHTVLVTDIGCIGLADKMFRTLHTVHTTHGRSTAFATGIALADSVLADKKLKVIVLIGDGGAMIGLQHLVHAAMLNVDVTVLICNNFVYGMTGGQGSGLTPECFVTATTPHGNIVPPVDLCEILRHSNAPFVARELATDKSLASTLSDAIASPGFAAVEILELCTEYAVRNNKLNGETLLEIAHQHQWKLGRLVEREDRKVFHERLGKHENPESTKDRESNGESTQSFSLRHPVSVVIAGSAGERVQSAAALVCEAAIHHGGFATQKNDNPVTQGSGFSLSEFRISPHPIGYTGIQEPDILIVTSEEGWNEVLAQGLLQRLGPTSRVYVDESVAVRTNDQRIVQKPFRSVLGPKAAALGSLLWLATQRGFIPAGQLFSVVEKKYGRDYVGELEKGISAFH